MKKKNENLLDVKLLNCTRYNNDIRLLHRCIQNIQISYKLIVYLSIERYLLRFAIFISTNTEIRLVNLYNTISTISTCIINDITIKFLSNRTKHCTYFSGVNPHFDISN